MRGLLAWGAYVPYARLDRKAIAAALGASAGSGVRAVASYDEDSTSMGVEAARAALRATSVTPEAVYFATADPAYLDKTNATAIHAALDLPASAAAYDMLGSVRSAAGALRAALDARGPALAVVSDVRTGLAGGGDEREGGDAAAAFVFGEGPIVAEPLGHASQSAEFLDRWRVPGDSFSRQWEERFGEHVYVPLGEAALAEALKQAGVTASAVDVLIVAGPHARSNKRVAAAAGVKKEAIADDLAASVGNAGAAHAGLMLAAALDGARADQVIAVLSLADGADATVWRTTEAIAARRPAVTVADRERGRAVVRHVLDVARLPAPRAAAASGPAAARGAGRRARRELEVRVHRQPVPGVRDAPRAAATRLRQVSRRRPHAARAPERRTGDHRDVHGRSARVFDVAARRGRGDRLRGRRPLPVRDDGRGPEDGEDRRSRGADVPPSVHGERDPQLLLESETCSLVALTITSFRSQH